MTLNFNSRPSARGDGGGSHPPKSNQISIHAPPRGATLYRLLKDNKIKISIHAPPRGATSSELLRRCRCKISIHAPPRGATGRSRCRDFGGFISIHAPPRGATKIARGNVLAYQISIHAPPRGATCDRDAFGYSPILFQFTPLREGRHHFFQLKPCVRCISIHAPPRGATQKILICECFFSNFNSRPSARGDLEYLIHRTTP